MTTQTNAPPGNVARDCARHEVYEAACGFLSRDMPEEQARRALNALNTSLPYQHEASEIASILADARKAKSDSPARAGASDGRKGDGGTPAPELISATDLMSLDLKAPEFLVPGLLPAQGLAILAGKPKTGKSWLAYQLCIAVASGGYALGSERYRVKQGPAIYLALEDNLHRMQRRMRKLLQGTRAPDDLFISTDWPRMDQGGLEYLAEKVDLYGAGLVVVDTLQRFRPRGRGNKDPYGRDYDDIALLKGLADEKGFMNLLVHHLRKACADDIFDTVSGSLGLTGAADATLVLARSRGEADAVLHATGRDFEEAKLGMRFDSQTGNWRAMDDDAEILALTDERREIWLLLRNTGNPMTPAEISKALGRKPVNTRMLLSRMLKDDEIQSSGRGLYTVVEGDEGIEDDE